MNIAGILYLGIYKQNYLQLLVLLTPLPHPKKAAIVHLGTSALSGHYVSYIKKNNKWILFNDSKVAETPDPVLGKGYFYIFKRND